MKAGIMWRTPEDMVFRISSTLNRPTLAAARLREGLRLRGRTEQPGGGRLAFEESSSESACERFEAFHGADDVMKAVFLLAYVSHEPVWLNTKAVQNRWKVARNGAASSPLTRLVAHELGHAYIRSTEGHRGYVVNQEGAVHLENLIYRQIDPHAPARHPSIGHGLWKP